MGYWSRYFEAVGDKPNKLLVEALRRFKPKKGAALDLGCGNLRDCAYLVSEGFECVEGVDHVQPPEVRDGVSVTVEAIERYTPKQDAYDLVSCCNTLFYFDEKTTARIISGAYESLKRDGLLIFNALAPQDDWVNFGDTGRFALDQCQLVSMLSAMPRKFIRRRTGATQSALGKERYGDSWKVFVQK